tara:strand:+ start:269 stop:460 length:192 start_codon:yes stop_codon:yes gene_type:complete
MAINVDEAKKINDLYTQIDKLSMENELLKAQIVTYSENQEASSKDILSRLVELKELVKSAGRS